jgi:uncharacterized protein YjbI with pentapeptide repeats
MDALPIQNIQPAQEKIYSFFLGIVHQWEPEAVLQEFEHLFITISNTVDSEVLHSLYEIIYFNNEEEFRNTLKRICYIIINNWWAARQYNAIQKLIHIFIEVKINDRSLSNTLNLLNDWMRNFVNSKDYQDLKLFTSLFEDREKVDWSHRYTAYLLAPQYVDLKNPREQREAARELAKHLKEKFKLDLAMYTAYSQTSSTQETRPKNPTRLGDQALNLIKRIVAKRGLFSYSNLANIFVQQNQKISYKFFKSNIQKYIFYLIDISTNINFIKTLKIELAKKLEFIYEEYHEDTLNDELILRTCQQIIDSLTTEDRQQPSLLFILLISHNETLTLAIILLKLVLICKKARAHLEDRIASLIQFYEKLSESDCWGVIQFLEVLNLVFTIYTEDVEYNLVNINDETTDDQIITDLGTYRVFSQLKCDVNLKGANLSDTDLHGANLSGVNLHGANLSKANLSDADLSHAKLSNADLSHANLKGAELIAADLNNATLNSTNLRGADLRRVNLSNANLSKANLIATKLRLADLRDGNLTGANLGGANLNGANVNHANLKQSNLRHADLSGANLSGANLSGAELCNADLSGANLSDADLSNANLRHASLINVNLCNAHLMGADLGRVNLKGANLSGVDLSFVRVEYARFEGNLGLAEETKLSLKHRGAIVADGDFGI